MILALLIALQDPEEERKSFRVADGFEVNLFAAEPQVVKPIQIVFDAEGRLWVASSAVYPQVKPGEVPNDKIYVLEDRLGAGRADVSRVFAEGLFIPTGIEVGDGGAYVANSTELLHLKGRERAEDKRVLLSGFGTEDTHHMIHSFRWGPDGALYFNQSIYIHSNLETPHGTKRLGGGGIWRFRPETMEIDVFVRGMCNPWGHSFDRFGQSFGTDGAGSDGIHFLIPGATYPHFPGPGRHFPGLNPGHPKYCGQETVSGRHLPDEWQGDILTNDFRANRVCRFKLQEDGAGFSAKLMPDVIRSTDRAFRPVDVKMGPDGAIYIADWYNPIINHGEVDFRDPRRDHTHGRIWRLTAKGRPLVPRPNLAKAETPELLDDLKAPEGWTRHFARRTLKDRADAAAKLSDWVKRHAGDETALLEGLWTCEALRIAQPDLVRRLMVAKDHRVRAAAVRAAATWGIDVSRQAADEHPRVRLEAVRAATDIRTALVALDYPVDRFLEYAIWITANDLKDRWLPEFEAGKLSFGPKQMSFALQAVRAPGAVKALLDSVRAGKAGLEDPVVEIVAGVGGAEDLRALFELAPRNPKVLAALGRAARDRNLRPAGDLAGRIESLLEGGDPPPEALRLAGTWKLDKFRGVLARLTRSGSDAVRQGAIDGLADMGAADELRKLSAEPGARMSAVAALATLDLEDAAGMAPEALAGPGDRALLFRAFLARSGGAEILARALAGKPLASAAAKAGLDAMYAAGREEAALVKVLAPAAGMPFKARALVGPADVARGDPARGERLFHRRDLACFQCHAISGAGGLVGPDLASLGSASPLDYIVESVLDPSKSIKEGYACVKVLTKRGEVLTGVKVRQTDKELVLRDAIRDEISIPLDTIKIQKDAGSIMPAGLTDGLSQQEFLDLIRFLSELGRQGPYAATGAAVIRRWRLDEGGVPMPAYSLVSGVLECAGAAEVRCDIDVTTAGRIRLKLGWADEFDLSVDGSPRAAKPEVELDLGRGLHALAFTPKRPAKFLRVELEQVEGSTGRALPLGGR